MFNNAKPSLTILRDYAVRRNPQKLPPSVLFDFTDSTIAIFDGYPKSIFHFLILPRPKPSLTVFDLADLRTLLTSKTVDRDTAKAVLDDLANHAKKLRGEIETEMQKRYGFKWKIWTGFHAVPSMQHLHLHVISSDLCAPAMKTKKHYNSFHPARGFFLHLDDVMSWFDAVPSFFEEKAALRASSYEPLLKHDLECYRCGKSLKNFPILKEHLQKEFDTWSERVVRKASATPKPLSQSSDKKRKREAGGIDPDSPLRKKPTSVRGSSKGSSLGHSTGSSQGTSKTDG